MFDMSSHEANEIVSELRQQWDEKGYVILDNAIDESLIGELNDDIDRLWVERLSDANFEFFGLMDDEGHPCNISQAECLKLDAAKREWLKNNCHWRVVRMHVMLSSGAKIAANRKVQEVMDVLVGESAPVTASINFLNGSAQTLHQDQAVFHSFPLGKLIGCWIALEDIHPDSGPLVYYPGSHKEPLYHEFNNYPQTNLRTIDVSKHIDYYDHVHELAKGYERREFIARKGQLLLWHASLLHGGAPVNDMSLSRKSYVLHYMPERCNYHEKVTGPTNW